MSRSRPRLISYRIFGTRANELSKAPYFRGFTTCIHGVEVMLLWAAIPRKSIFLVPNVRRMARGPRSTTVQAQY